MKSLFTYRITKKVPLREAAVNLAAVLPKGRFERVSAREWVVTAFIRDDEMETWQEWLGDSYGSETLLT